MRYRGTGMRVFRRPRDIARHPMNDYYWLHYEWSLGERVVVEGRELMFRPGDLVLKDTTAPLAVEAKADYDHQMWLLPRSLLDPHLPISQRPRALTPIGSSGVAGMVKAYLDALGRQIDALDGCETALVADNFCRLLAVACGAAADEHQEAVRLARLEEAKRYIDLHLADPELAPEKAAAALKMSVRQLHLLFEPSGTSFSQYVLRRRLEECRAALLNPVGGRSVTDIALGFGFNSPWTFNRTFRRAFGVTPSEMRVRERPSVSPTLAE
jgi:AraC-like DNA-binding protein